jgi:hypothetical protein
MTLHSFLLLTATTQEKLALINIPDVHKLRIIHIAANVPL